MTAQFVALHMEGMEPLCRMVPAADALADAHDIASHFPGAVVWVLTPEQAQELTACAPERREHYLANKRSVAFPPPVAMWENEQACPLPGEEQ